MPGYLDIHRCILPSFYKWERQEFRHPADGRGEQEFREHKYRDWCRYIAGHDPGPVRDPDRHYEYAMMRNPSFDPFETPKVKRNSDSSGSKSSDEKLEPKSTTQMLLVARRRHNGVRTKAA